MNYHNITYPDMLNGNGLRVVLWLSGCSHKCYKCQNPQTWDINSGIQFDENAKEELFRELSKDYISGLTLTGGDPLHENNVEKVYEIVCEVHSKFPNKTIWLYTGFTWEELNQDIEEKRFNILKHVDVLVEGKYIDSQRDVSLHWRGSSNQRVIDIKKSLKKGEIVLWDTN